MCLGLPLSKPGVALKQCFNAAELATTDHSIWIGRWTSSMRGTAAAVRKDADLVEIWCVSAN